VSIPFDVAVPGGVATATHPAPPSRITEEGWPPEIEHLSASMLGTLVRCPELFRRRYLLGEKERPSIHLSWGSAIHKTHETNFRQKIDSHTDLPTTVVQEIWRESLRDVVENDEKSTQKEMDWKDLSFDAVVDRGAMMVAAYHLKAAPRIQPIAVEERFELPAHSGSGQPGDPPANVPLIGYVDVETEKRGIDLKTTGRKSIGNDWRAQGAIYTWAKQKPFEFQLIVKTATPQVITGSDWKELVIPHTPTSALQAVTFIRQGVSNLKMLYRDYGRYEPWPAAKFMPGSTICGFCGFRPSCFWWAEG
jgi:hypothetical protein